AKRLVLIERHGSPRHPVLPDAEAHVPLLAEIPRDPQGSARVQRMRPEELDDLPTLHEAAPRTEAVARLDVVATAGTGGHTPELRGRTGMTLVDLSPLSRLLDHQLGAEPNLDGEHVTSDPVAVVLDELSLGVRGGQDDPVGDLEALVLPQLVHL